MPPPLYCAAAIIERDYLWQTAIKIDRERLASRILPIFNVFTQHLSKTRQQEVLEEMLRAIHVLPDYEPMQLSEKFRYFNAGLNGSPSAYKRPASVVEVAESKFDVKGYLEWAVIQWIGEARNNLFRIITHHVIAANAVDAFYLDRSSYGLPKKSDNLELLIPKYLVPIEFQGKETRKLAYRLGNHAKELEKKSQGAGLQYIYEVTK